MVKVSVIIPVYNTAKYLDKCIDSIINQTFRDFEVIVIDDGSTDKSKKIIQNYCEKYSFIRGFYQENKGRGKTRNLGVEYSKGQYICFVDSDDYVEENYLEKLYNKINSDNYDIVVCNYYSVKDGKRKKISCGINEDLLDKQKIKNYMAITSSVLWNKIYRRDILKQISFTEELFFEDVDFSYKMYAKLNKIGVVKEYIYNYKIRKGSATNVCDERWYDLEKSMQEIIKYYKENNLYESYYDEIEYIYIRYIFGTLIKNIAKSEKYNQLKNVRKYAKALVSKTFPFYTNNKYIKKINLRNIYFYLIGIY